MSLMNFSAGPMGQAFLDSRAFLKLVMGPVGSGKSTVAIWDLFLRAISQEPFNNVRRTKMILMRNTVQQLKATVKPLIDQWFVTLPGGSLGKWRLTENVFEFDFVLGDGTQVYSEFCLMAADTPDDVRRLLSLEASAAWCEEAREIDPDVFSGLQGRVNRFPNRAAGGVTYPGVICSTNPPPVGGFWHGMISAPDKGCEVFIQPPALLDDGSLNPEAENLANLAPEYYENLVAGKTDDWIDVYLKNKYGAGDLGQPIYKSTFKRSFHVSDKPLSAIMQTLHPLIVGMDNGLQAAATIGQQDARGRVNILGEVYVPADETMGVETFMDRLCVPYIRGKFPQFRPENIVFVLDPACWQRSQADEKTVAQVVMQRGYQVVKASTNDPERRIDAVEQLLARQIDGGAAFLIDPSCTHIANALEWGHRYKKSASGLTSSLVEKNHFSHCFVAGTIVATTEGPVPIERVTCDHLVHTPAGPAEVIATLSHFSDDLVELEFSDGGRVTCTGDHPFFTSRGVVLANALEYNEVLFSIGEKTCLQQNTPSKSLTELATTESPTGTTNPTSLNTEAALCTGLCGNGTTGLSRQGSTSTTSTATRPTTVSRTLSALVRRATRHITGWSETLRTMVSLRRFARSNWQDQKPPSGTGRKPAYSGTPRTENAPGKVGNEFSLPARTARSRILGSRNWPSEGSAPCPAREEPAKNPASTTKRVSAPSAEPIFQPTSTAKPERAVRLVGKRRLVGQGAKVYDLTVLNEHCFYANGILVSNCGDAVQYLSLHYNVQADGAIYNRRTKARTVVHRRYAYT